MMRALHRSCVWWWLTILIVVPGLGAELVAIPHAALERVDPAIGEQLRRARGDLEDLAAEAETDEVAMAGAYGGLGQLYLVYGLQASAEACFVNAEGLDPSDPRWVYYRAVILQDSGRLESASNALSVYLLVRPGEATASLRAAQVELELAELASARRLFEQALLSPGTAAAARYGLGQIALLEGRPQDAVELYQEVLASQPEASSAHYQLGLAYRALGDVDRARDHLARHGRRAVGFEDVLMDTLRSRTTGAALHVVDGALARTRGDYGAAIEAFQRALAENPDDLAVQLALAWSYAHSGATEKALETFQQVLQVDPENASAHYNVGTILARQGDLSGALVPLRMAVAGAPGFAPAHLSLAAVLARLQRFEAAEEEYSKALRLNPRLTDARLQRANVLLRLHRAEEAEQELREVVAREPDNVDAYLGLARILSQTGRPGEAAAAFAKIVELAPQEEGARYGRALNLLLDEQYDEARLSLEDSLILYPESASLKDLLARLLAAVPDDGIRDGARAVELAQEALEAEQQADYAETLAMALAEVGRFGEAADLQEQIIRQATRVGLTELIPALRRHLVLYQSGRPCRTPWLEGRTRQP